MIQLHLTAEQRQELQRVSRQAVGRVALRAHLVLLSDRGYSVPQIATIHACGQDVVRTWLHRYKEKGVAGLEDEPRRGRPRRTRWPARLWTRRPASRPRARGRYRPAGRGPR